MDVKVNSCKKQGRSQFSSTHFVDREGKQVLCTKVIKMIFR